MISKFQMVAAECLSILGFVVVGFFVAISLNSAFPVPQHLSQVKLEWR